LIAIGISVYSCIDIYVLGVAKFHVDSRWRNCERYSISLRAIVMPDTSFLTRNISINLYVFINFADYQIDELPVTVHG